MANDQFSHASNSEQFVISYELLCLLRWLIENDAEKLKKIITKALSAGLNEEIKKIERFSSITTDAPHIAEEMQHSIIDFFHTMEVILLESINELTIQKAVEQKLMPAIDHIDASTCDETVVRSSIEKATSTSALKPGSNVQELLFKELLKNWKPSKKTYA